MADDRVIARLFGQEPEGADQSNQAWQMYQLQKDTQIERINNSNHF